jgi:hypothetical protein
MKGHPSFRWTWKSLLNGTKAKIIVFVSLAAGAAAFLGNLEQISHFFKRMFKPEGVQFVNVSFKDSDSLDIQLRNTGNEVSVVKRIEIRIRRKWVLRPDGEAKSALVASGNYNLKIDTAIAPGDIVSKNVSQQLEPGKADRFFVSLGAIQKDIPNSYIYQADIVVVSDEDDSRIKRKDVFFLLESEGAVYFLADSSAPNSMIARSVDSISGIKSDRLDEVLKDIKGSQ